MENKIQAGHGSGGIMTRKLIRGVFARYFDNEWIRAEGDSAVFKARENHIAFTTDSYVINPLFFPGGDLGKLAICGTVNDLAVAGAHPAYITAGFIIEEGLEMNILETIVASMQREAKKAGVDIVSGDTKVVGKGQADGLYINTSGVGFVKDGAEKLVSGKMIAAGDAIYVNGSIGDHEAAIINAREQIFETSQLSSDCASLNGLVAEILENCEGIHFMRDITRGGMAGVLSEVAELSGKGIDINETNIPCNESVTAFCEVLGYEPLHFANEGKCLIIANEAETEKLELIMKKHEHGKGSARIGTVCEEHPGELVMETIVGGKRLVEPPYAQKVPRIC